MGGGDIVFCSLNSRGTYPGPYSWYVSEVGSCEPNSLDSEVSSVERALAMESEVWSLNTTCVTLGKRNNII